MAKDEPTPTTRDDEGAPAKPLEQVEPVSDEGLAWLRRMYRIGQQLPDRPETGEGQEATGDE